MSQCVFSKILEILIFSIWPGLRSPPRRRWWGRPGGRARCTRAGRRRPAAQLAGEDGPEHPESSSALIGRDLSRYSALIGPDLISARERERERERERDTQRERMRERERETERERECERETES